MFKKAYGLFVFTQREGKNVVNNHAIPHDLKILTCVTLKQARGNVRVLTLVCVSLALLRVTDFTPMTVKRLEVINRV